MLTVKVNKKFQTKCFLLVKPITKSLMLQAVTQVQGFNATYALLTFSKTLSVSLL